MEFAFTIASGCKKQVGGFGIYESGNFLIFSSLLAGKYCVMSEVYFCGIFTAFNRRVAVDEGKGEGGEDSSGGGFMYGGGTDTVGLPAENVYLIDIFCSNSCFVKSKKIWMKKYGFPSG